MIIVNYVVSVLLLVLGLYAVCTQKNLIKIVLGLGVIDYGINLLIVSVGFNDGGTAPIFTISDLTNGLLNGKLNFFVDPVPQALTLTSIVIGACVTAMALALVIMIYRKYKTVNADEVRRIRG